MKTAEAIAILKRHEAELRHRGVKHIALFGSQARGDAHAGSDIDILVEFDETNMPGLFAYTGLVHYIGDLFPLPVDIANKSSLKPHVRPSAEGEALYAF